MQIIMEVFDERIDSTFKCHSYEVVQPSGDEPGGVRLFQRGGRVLTILAGKDELKTIYSFIGSILAEQTH